MDGQKPLVYNTILSLQKHSDVAIADKSLRTVIVYIELLLILL